MAKIQTSNDYKISVVIGTFNRTKSLYALLVQLVDCLSDIPMEVLVFDQSAEENYLITKTQFPKLKNFHLYRLEKPNTCKYLNLGWQKAQSPIVLYIDDDVTITNKTLHAHLNQYNRENVLAVAGRVINDGETESKNSQVGKVLFYGAVITKNFSYDKSMNVDFPYGCNMSFRKKTLQQINGFDELLKPPIYAYNEVDIGVRITHRWPQSMLFEPEALVYHHRYPHGGTRSFTAKDVQKSIDFNYGYFLGKNFKAWQNCICFFRRLPFQIIKEPTKLKDILKGFWYAKKKS